MAHRLGASQVTTVEIDPQIAAAISRVPPWSDLHARRGSRGERRHGAARLSYPSRRGGREASQ
ncbi:MAG TPA: hypothetical protein VGL88_11540 [Pseudonocardiaceae bacterium]